MWIQIFFQFRSPTESSATITTNDNIISPTIALRGYSLHRVGTRIPAISLRAAICVVRREQNHRGHRHLPKSEHSSKTDAANKRRTLNYPLQSIVILFIMT
eukprot:XP_016664014.1 PREDICTED: uncharacterized protein LOC107885093 [Acyrthosiphon pisum]